MRGESIPERGARNLLVMTGGRVAIHAVLVVSAFWIPRALGASSHGRYAAVFAVVLSRVRWQAPPPGGSLVAGPLTCNCSHHCRQPYCITITPNPRFCVPRPPNCTIGF